PRGSGPGHSIGGRPVEKEGLRAAVKLPAHPQLIFFDLEAQGLAVDSQDAGGFLAAALGAVQDELDVALFHVLQGMVFLGKHLELRLKLGRCSGSTMSPSSRMMMRSRVCSSSRTLPGQA